MKKLLFTGLVTMAFIAFNAVFAFDASAAKNCCNANCKLGKCSINSGASACICGCDPGGNPRCTGQASNRVTADPIQMANLSGARQLTQSFGTPAGLAASNMLNNIMNLFSANNFDLHNNAPGGNVETYYNFTGNLSQIVTSGFTSEEQQQYNLYLESCPSSPDDPEE